MAKNEPTLFEPESNYSGQPDKGSIGAHNRESGKASHCHPGGRKDIKQLSLQ